MTTPTLSALETQAGFQWLDHQAETLDATALMSGPSPKICLYYKTGAGKTVTSLAAMRQWGVSEALVVAPPATHKGWIEWGDRMGVVVDAISHAKFRMKTYQLSRHKAVIVDEFHLLGGHTGQGWRKMDRLAAGMQAPLVLCSATPNYNDAERVYCIQHVLAPQTCRGGFLSFLYQNCKTVENFHSRIPDVTGFWLHANAAEYLASLPGVFYLEDDLDYTVIDVPVPAISSIGFDDYGFDSRSGRMMASQMERKHKLINNSLIDDGGFLREPVYDLVQSMRVGFEPTLIFAAHSTVAEALSRRMYTEGIGHLLVTGDTSKKKKQEYLDEFCSGHWSVLIGTASLATGPDGMDKVCDRLIIVDDTEDPSLRRQLIGRIMPRGTDTDATMKKVYRLALQ